MASSALRHVKRNPRDTIRAISLICIRVYHPEWEIIALDAFHRRRKRVFPLGSRQRVLPERLMSRSNPNNRKDNRLYDMAKCRNAG